MALVAVQNDSNNNLRRQSFLKSAMVGGAFSYVAKWAIPILPQEREDVFLSEALQAEEDSKVVKAELDLINKDAAKINGADEFVHLYNENKLDFSKKTNSEKNLPENLSKLYDRVLSKIKSANSDAIAYRTTQTKGIRPTIPFVATGILIGISYAIFNNIRFENAKNNSKKSA